VTTAAGTTQLRFGGFGGQGIVLAGRLVGMAASLYDGKEAVFTQAYGPEARGGASRADVIVSDTPVDYPYVTRPDVLAVMFQEAYLKFVPELAPGGTLIVDQDLVHLDGAHASALQVPANRMAEQLGNRIVANVVLAGFLAAATGVVSLAALEQAIRATVKPSALDLNLRAFAAGAACASAPAGEEGVR